jgi:hypothetical protein
MVKLTDSQLIVLGMCGRRGTKPPRMDPSTDAEAGRVVGERTLRGSGFVDTHPMTRF